MVAPKLARLVSSVALGLVVGLVACTAASEPPAAAPTERPSIAPTSEPQIPSSLPPPQAFEATPAPSATGNPSPLAPVPATATPTEAPEPPPVASLQPSAPAGWEAPLVVAATPGARSSSVLALDGPLYVSWAIENVGPDPSGTGFSVDLLLDGIPVERWGVEGLEAGESRSVVDWDILAARTRLSPGVHTLSLAVDPTGLVQPLTATGSRYSVRFELPAPVVSSAAQVLAPERQPNLAVHVPDGWDEPIRVVPGSADGAGLDVRISFKNAGLSSVPDFFQVYLYLDGVMVARFGQRGLVAQEVVVTLPWRGLIETMPLSSGEHVLLLALDPTRLVDETTRSDNSYSTTFVWSAAGALVPSSEPSASEDPATGPALAAYEPSGWAGPLVVAGEPGSPGRHEELYSDGRLYVSWALRNEGGTPHGGPILVDLLLDGRVVADWVRPGLAADRMDFVVDRPIAEAPAPGVHRFALRLREPDGTGAGRILAERATIWFPGPPPPTAPTLLTTEEVQRRLSRLEALRSTSMPTVGSGSAGAATEVLEMAGVVYAELYGRAIDDESLSVHIVSKAEYGDWVDAECRDVAGGLLGESRATYLEACSRAKDFVGYQSRWRGLHRIVVQGERPPMQVLSTLAHELGHFVQSRTNPALDALTDLDFRAVREAQAYAHQTLFLRTLQDLTGFDLLLYPRIDGFDRFVPQQVAALVRDADRDEHARGKLLLWLALLTDPQLRGQRTVLFNTISLNTGASRELFDYLVALPPSEVRRYVSARFRSLSAQAPAIESIALARLVSGLPYWNEGPPFFREVGLLLP